MIARVPAEPAPRPWLYDALDGLGLKGYRRKIMTVTFLGIHLPLIALAVVFAREVDRGSLVWPMVVALAATLVGTALTLLALNALLRPVSLTSQALRRFRVARRREPLPTGYSDEVGVLMADAGAVMAELERTVDRLEHVDPSTGLPNRRGALRLIEARVGRGDAFGVAVLRFESFERIAATLDLERAELASRSVAARLKAQLALAGLRDEMLARVSKGEFALTVPACGRDGVEIATWLTALALRSGGEIDVGETRVRVDLPGGVALHPADSVDPRILLDHALASAARAGAGHPVVLHSPEMRAAARSRLRLEDDLRRALEGGELELHYQPVVDRAARRMVGVEALLRWRHSERGHVPPGEFVPMAEAMGLVGELDHWTLRCACRQARAWEEAGHPLVVAVNMSAHQLADPDLHRQVDDALRGAEARPDLLEVEITETVAMADHLRAREVLDGMRGLGVGVSIDDFGTGYASMSHLRRLSFNKLKIDREFVRGVERDPTSQAICAALLELCRGLGLTAVAEGAETEAEVEHLVGRGCTLFQGNFYGAAIPAAEIPPMLERIAARLP